MKMCAEMKTDAYMRILSRFVVQGNVFKVLQKLAEIEDLTEEKSVPWDEMVNHPSKESLALLACRYGHVAVLKALLLKGAPTLYFELPNLDGKRSIHEAVEYSQQECVEFLVETVGVSVNSLKRADWTPLMLACTKANPDMVCYLISHGTDVDFCNKDGWNAFHLACRTGDLEVVKLLYKVGSNSAITASHNGRSPLHTAALHGHSSVVRFLMEDCGYSTQACDAAGHTPTMDAQIAGHAEIAKLLESH